MYFLLSHLLFKLLIRDRNIKETCFLVVNISRVPKEHIYISIEHHFRYNVREFSISDIIVLIADKRYITLTVDYSSTIAAFSTNNNLRVPSRT